MRVKVITKKSKKKKEEKRCYFCKYSDSDKCPNKDIRRSDAICENFKWCAMMKSI